jgi:hypothetical protein
LLYWHSLEGAAVVYSASLPLLYLHSVGALLLLPPLLLAVHRPCCTVAVVGVKMPPLNT